MILCYIPWSWKIFQDPGIYSEFLDYISGARNLLQHLGIYSKILEYMLDFRNIFQDLRKYSKILEYTPGSQNTSIFPLTLSGLVDLYTGKIVKNPRLQIYDSPPTIHNSTIQDSRSMDPGVHGFMEPWIHGSMDPCIHESMYPWTRDPILILFNLE